MAQRRRGQVPPRPQVSPFPVLRGPLTQRRVAHSHHRNTEGGTSSGQHLYLGLPDSGVSPLPSGYLMRCAEVTSKTLLIRRNDSFSKLWIFEASLQKHTSMCVRLVAHLCLPLCDLRDCSPPGSSVHGDSPGKNTGVGCHALLQGIFPTQGLNLDLLHCRQILYHLSHQGSPSMCGWMKWLVLWDLFQNDLDGRRKWGQV